MISRALFNEALGKLRRIHLLKNLSWLMVAEVFSRVSRIVTLFVLAACFSNEQYGLVMLALLIHELFRVFTRLGTGAKIIQCADAHLMSTLENAASLQWLVAIGVASLQLLLAETIARFYQMPALTELLSVMALAHIFYPLVSVRIFEQHRKNKFRYYGLASGGCIAFENLLVAALILIDVNLVLVAWAKVAAAAFWVVLFIRLPSECTRLRWQWQYQKELSAFAFATLASELSRMLRFQSDSLIAARLLPADLFGLYSFAKSAGLGIAQSFSQAYLSSLYPYFCQRQRDLNAGEVSSSCMAKKVTSAICALFFMQACLSLFYVEWLFDDRWAEASVITAVLCLVAIPTLAVDHHAMKLRAAGRAVDEMKFMLLCTAVLSLTLLVIQPTTALSTALTVLACSASWIAVLCSIQLINQSTITPTSQAA